MKILLSICALIVSLIGSWFFWHGDFKLQHHLISKEWKSTSVAYMNLWDQKVSDFDKAVIYSTMKYLPNHTYIKNSTLVFSSPDFKKPVEINIAESGNWDLSDHYLLVGPMQFKDITTTPITQITPAQAEELKTLFKVNSQQSRKIDVIDKNTLLVTSLGHGSTVMYAQ
ncbi:MAG: regulatory protein ToxS [Vibrio sp.]